MMHAALLIILHLDLAQEARILNAQERDLRAKLKRKVIALAVIERARRKQSARIANIREGDANTKFFHLRVNARRRKKPHSSHKAQQWVGHGSWGQGTNNPKPLLLGYG
jgi:hypothetical protein